MEKFEFKDMGDLKWFLGIRVIRDRDDRKLWLCQDSYLENLAKKFDLTGSVRFKTPMGVEELLPNEGLATPEFQLLYQQKIGSIIYPSIITRPDVAFACNKLSQFLQNPSKAHMVAADRIILYLNGTRTYAIEFSYGDFDEIKAYFDAFSDSAFADDSTSRKSTMGFIFKLFGGPIDWKSSKGKTVTTSSTEAELLALSRVAIDLYWWRRFFSNIKLDLEQQYAIWCDNLQTIRLLEISSPKLSTKLKHVDIHQHWLRQELEEKRLRIEWISTNEMEADGFTKPLPRLKHESFIKQLGLVDISALLSTLR